MEVSAAVDQGKASCIPSKMSSHSRGASQHWARAPTQGQGLHRHGAWCCHLALQQQHLEAWHIHVTSVGRSCAVPWDCQRKTEVHLFCFWKGKKKKTTLKKYSLRCKDACTWYCLGHPRSCHSLAPRRVWFQWQQDTLHTARTSTVPVQPGENSLSAPVTNLWLYSPQLLQSVVAYIQAASSVLLGLLPRQ